LSLIFDSSGWGFANLNTAGRYTYPHKTIMVLGNSDNPVQGAEVATLQGLKFHAHLFHMAGHEEVTSFTAVLGFHVADGILLAVDVGPFLGRILQHAFDH
jgi:hypothetical protein